MNISRRQVPPLKANFSKMPRFAISWSRWVSTISFSAIMMLRSPASTK